MRIRITTALTLLVFALALSPMLTREFLTPERIEAPLSLLVLYALEIPLGELLYLALELFYQTRARNRKRKK